MQARRLGARLRVVTVEDIGVMKAEALAGAGLLAVGYETGEAARDAMVKAKARVARAGTEADFALLPLAEPATAIVREAEKAGASLIIVGSHGRTGIARALLGSVAERVVRHAHCSVMVVR